MYIGTAYCPYEWGTWEVVDHMAILSARQGDLQAFAEAVNEESRTEVAELPMRIERVGAFARRVMSYSSSLSIPGDEDYGLRGSHPFERRFWSKPNPDVEVSCIAPIVQPKGRYPSNVHFDPNYAHRPLRKGEPFADFGLDAVDLRFTGSFKTPDTPHVMPAFQEKMAADGILLEHESMCLMAPARGRRKTTRFFSSPRVLATVYDAAGDHSEDGRDITHWLQVHGGQRGETLLSQRNHVYTPGSLLVR